MSTKQNIDIDYNYDNNNNNNDYDDEDMNIEQIFNEVTKYTPMEPNAYPLHFELNSLKELFEFLLEFVTMLCKKYYGDENQQVNLANMNLEDFVLINKYMNSIGFNCNFNALPTNATNINNTYNNRYDRIEITNNTKLSDLLFGIKCDTILYVISFCKI
jgi:hypothetical protein